MNYSRLESQITRIWTDHIVIYGSATVLAAVHVVSTQIALYWTHPYHSDRSRAPLIAFAGVCLSSLFVQDLSKRVRHLTADRVSLKEALSEINKSFTLSTTLSAVAVACNLMGMFFAFPPEYLWLGVAGAVGLLLVVPAPKDSNYQPQILRGTTMRTIDDVEKQIRAERPPEGSYECWAGLQYRNEYAKEHYLACGTTYSAKTVLQRMHMGSTLPRIVPGSDWRALIFDPKGDMLSIVAGIAPHCPIHLMKAIDYRSVAWDLAVDIDSPGTAEQIASVLVRMDTGDNNPFFVHAARIIITGVMVAFIITRPRQWTLSDVLKILSNKDKTEALLRSVPQTRHRADQCFGEMDEKTVGNVLYTLYAHLSRMEWIAAASSHATKKISLRQWLTEESILILGHDEMHRSSMQAMNLAMLECLHQLVLSQSESQTRRTLLYLDELPLLGKWESLPLFLDMSRSKGACVFLTFQLIEHLRAIYGDHLADAIAGLPGNKSFLRTDSVPTAQWASETIGKCDVMRYTYGETFGKDKSFSLTEVRDFNHPTVLPSEIMRLPRANRERFFGYFLSPIYGAFHGPVYFQPYLVPKAHLDDFVPRPVSHQYLHGQDEPADTEKAPVTLDDITRVTAGDDDSPWDNTRDPLLDCEEPLDDTDALEDEQS